MVTYTNSTIVSASREANRVQAGAVLVLIAGLISVLLAGGFYYWGTNIENNTKEIKSQITTVESKFKAEQTTYDQLTKLTNIGSELKVITGSQSNWETVFNNITSHMYKNMKVLSWQISNKKTLTLIGMTPDYKEYAKVFSSFTNEGQTAYFKTVRPTSVTKVDAVVSKDGVVTEDAGIKFTFNIELTDEAFKVKK